MTTELSILLLSFFGGVACVVWWQFTPITILVYWNSAVMVIPSYRAKKWSLEDLLALTMDPEKPTPDVSYQYPGKERETFLPEKRIKLKNYMEFETI